MYKLIKQRAKNMQGYFETPAAQKQLASIGRKMQDYSEDFGKVNGLGHLKEPGLHILNELSQVGGMMIRYGVIFGTKKKDFTDRDFQLIAEFMKGKYSNEYLSGLKQVKK